MLLMEKVRDENRDVVMRTGLGVRKNVPFFIYKCPKGEMCTEKHNESYIAFECSRGWSNPYTHLVTCVGGGNEEDLLKVYKAAVEEQ